ncbi:MAG TPA: CoA-binding protein [Pirellulaceae bacterium]|nr:CoA-binding protein [Pirellulaceae bacterium]HMO92329.1 CoA-binding protein [Pirellulaceae bacterium]HMP69253.1 CoA-binding protein [Pirellulaceae bacterium]
MNGDVQQFLSGSLFAVIGATSDRNKYGNKVLRCYLQNGRQVVPVNPHAASIEGLTVYPNLTSIGAKIDGISIITPPKITDEVVQEALALGIRNIWMQPGAESESAIKLARQAGVNVIAHGPCLLVVLGYREEA